MVSNEIDKKKTWCFFDGVAASNIGGAGFTLHISSSHYFHVQMGCGVSTNTRVELLALWALLVFADTIGLPSLFVCGDSQVIINWENSVARLDAVDLDH